MNSGYVSGLNGRNRTGKGSMHGCILLLGSLFVFLVSFPVHQASQQVLIQGSSSENAEAHVRAVGGTVTHRLPTINAVGAWLSAAQLHVLGRANVRVVQNQQAKVAGGATSDPDYGHLIGVDQLHQQGILGTGVTVAVVDTGLWSQRAIAKNVAGQDRVLAYYNAIENHLTNAPKNGLNDDQNGHGSHITSVLASSDTTSSGEYNGIAPNSDLVVVKAFDVNGVGNYFDVIRGIDWVITNKTRYNIRVLNLSFSAPPQSSYWDDPLNQVVMRAWKAGIVVVAAAGNGGPQPMTIGAPGNVPYIITVGAFTDSYTPTAPNDDAITSFSAAGPTVEGFVKPDVVAPGGHIQGLVQSSMQLSRQHREGRDGGNTFVMSGTSQAAAITSGVAALVLQQNPSLTAEQVKQRLMMTADTARRPDGSLAYSVFQQGAGRINALQAARSSIREPANSGLNIDADLAGTTHYGGKADRDGVGNYFISGLDGFVWNGSLIRPESVLWTGGAWSGGLSWSGGSPWTNTVGWSGEFVWSGGVPWNAASVWTPRWVAQE